MEQGPPKKQKNWAIFRKHMINEYKLKTIEGGGTKMGQEFGIAMHVTDTNTEEDSLTEAVTKYAERATRAEANMAEMEGKFEERFVMLSMTAQKPQSYAPPSPQYPETHSLCRHHISQHHPHRSYHHPQLSTSPAHNNRHHTRNTMRVRKDAKDRERGAKGAAPSSGNVIYLTEAAVDAAVEEAVSQRTQRTTINQTEVPEETQPQHSGTTSEEQGAAETTSGIKTEADNVGEKGNPIQTHKK